MARRLLGLVPDNLLFGTVERSNVELKHLVFFGAMAVGMPPLTLAATVSRRVREVVFALMVFSTTQFNLADINFVSREWYRGTTLGIEVSFVDFLAVALLLGTALDRSRPRPHWLWPPSLGLMMLFLMYSAASLIWAEPRLFAVLELSKMVRGLLFFLAVAQFVRTKRDLRLMLVALACAVFFEAGVALCDRYLHGVYRVGGSLHHANSLSMFICVAAPPILAAAASDERRLLRWFLAGATGAALVTVLLTVSRTGVLTLLIVLAGTAALTNRVRLSPRWVAASLLAVAVVSGLLWKASDTLLNRYDDTSVAELDSATKGRGQYLHEAALLVDRNPLGVGLNNWSYHVSRDAGPSLGLPYVPYRGVHAAPDQEIPSYTGVLDAAQAPPAHNLLALTAGELGIPGLALFLLLWAGWFALGLRFLRRRSADLVSRFGVGVLLAILAAFLHSGTEWVFRQSHVYFLFHILLGAVAALRVLVRRSARSRP